MGHEVLEAYTEVKAVTTQPYRTDRAGPLVRPAFAVSFLGGYCRVDNDDHTPVERLTFWCIRRRRVAIAVTESL